MNVNLDLDTLRTLVVATELGGFGHAAKRLGRTPSAVSLQMKRLTDVVGARLFRKAGRAVVLTETGALALGYARRMLALNDELLDTVRGASLRGNARLGCTQDFADSVLPTVLERYAQLYPQMQLEVRIEGNAALAEAVSTGHLDLALVIGHAQRPTAKPLGELPLMWIAGPQFRRRDDLPLPLVMLGPQCAFRQEATRLLEADARSWRLAAVSPSLAGIWASARGGLGVTLRSPLGLPADFQRGETLFDLPRAGTMPVTLLGRTKGVGEGLKRLASIVVETATASMAALGG